ncbi:hypothetical protein [Haloprofundus sp. MHR1]|uniref:hypothetical protein n=1 Tax=Haloprofundus sp. MHR1 TaxID=2572921 RepID=UPI0010BF5F56|nr:hypothetical protein [Haloprofundus sp. MHR1]QCJ48419.1 hypothetical protein FCF25_15340 [Haloprofundus sp. MHR1]
MTRDDSGTTDNDPTRIRSIAVTADDVVAALEARRRRGVPAVLRVTPPFAGRMRARLHLAGGEGSYEGPTEPIHLDPERLVADVPPFPDPDETEDRLREAGDYSVDAHRDEHAEAVRRWRETVTDAIVEAVTVGTENGGHEITVKRLG